MGVGNFETSDKMLVKFRQTEFGKQEKSLAFYESFSFQNKQETFTMVFFITAAGSITFSIEFGHKFE